MRNTEYTNHNILSLAPLKAAFATFVIALISAAQASDPKVPFHLGGGWEGYRENCVSCHGEWGNGTDKGPPLMHSYYLPGHHDDSSFMRAITQGTRAHHWNFGDMPPVTGVNPARAEQIIAYIRWLQKEKGSLQ